MEQGISCVSNATDVDGLTGRGKRAKLHVCGQIGTVGQVGRVTAPGRAVIADKASLAQRFCMIGTLAPGVRPRLQLLSASLCKLWVGQQARPKSCVVIAAMASDGIPRTRENSITKTSAFTWHSVLFTRCRMLCRPCDKNPPAALIPITGMQVQRRAFA